MEGTFDFWFEEGIKLFEEWFKMSEVVVKEIAILVAVAFG